MQRPQSSNRDRSTSLPLPPLNKLRRPSQEILESAFSTIPNQKNEEPTNEKAHDSLKESPTPPRSRTRRPSLAEQFNFMSELVNTEPPANVKDPKTLLVKQLRRKWNYSEGETHPSQEPNDQKNFSERPMMSPRVVLAGVTRSLSPSRSQNFFGPEAGPIRRPTLNRKSTLGSEPIVIIDETIPLPGNNRHDVKALNQYVFSKTVGQGTYGKVKLATNTENGMQVAIKIIHKQQLKRIKRIRSNKKMLENNSLQNFLIEVAIMKKLRHPNVIELYEVLDDHTKDKLYLVLEYAEKGQVLTMENAEKMSDSLPLDKCWKYFRDLICGLDYLHQHNIVHCDIKPANLLISAKDTLKICDFGVAQILDDSNDQQLSTANGSPAFFAPEMSDKKSFLGRPVDIWAAGITLYCFIYGHVPFVGKNIVLLSENIRNEPLSFDFPLEASLQDLLLKLLEKDPVKRIMMPGIKTHPWVTRNGLFPIKDHVDEILVTDHDVESAIHRVSSKNLLFHTTTKTMRTVPSLDPLDTSTTKLLLHSLSRSPSPRPSPRPLARNSQELFPEINHVKNR